MKKFKPYFDNYWAFPDDGDFEFMTPAIGFNFVRHEKKTVSWILFFSIGFWVFGIMYNSDLT